MKRKICPGCSLFVFGSSVHQKHVRAKLTSNLSPIGRRKLPPRQSTSSICTGSYLRDKRQFVPARGKALRQHGLPHTPVARNALCAEEERVAPENAIERVNNRH